MASKRPGGTSKKRKYSLLYLITQLFLLSSLRNCLEFQTVWQIWELWEHNKLHFTSIHPSGKYITLAIELRLRVSGHQLKANVSITRLYSQGDTLSVILI